MPFLHLVLRICALALIAQLARAQSGRPPGYIDNIEDQMAEMQAQVRYGGFVESLDLPVPQLQEIEAAINAVFVDRTRASRARSSGQAAQISLARSLGL